MDYHIRSSRLLESSKRINVDKLRCKYIFSTLEKGLDMGVVYFDIYTNFVTDEGGVGKYEYHPIIPSAGRQTIPLGLFTKNVGQPPQNCIIQA